MRVLVTGAGGFLGRHVVRALHRRGHEVVALLRPAADIAAIEAVEAVEGVRVARADLRAPAGLAGALDGVHAVVHLAAAVSGDEDAQFAATVIGTERLLEAVAGSDVERFVLASSIAVYDWGSVDARLTEDSPTVQDVDALDRRGGYTVAKLWQERLTRRAAEQQGWELTILRPGFIWAAGREPLAGIGQTLGPLLLVLGPRRPLPITYVENCAERFAQAVDIPAAAGRTLNVIDPDTVSAWRFATEYLRRSRADGRCVPVPYRLGRAIAQLAGLTSRTAFGPGGRLPSILTLEHFEARFKPLDFPSERLRSVFRGPAPLTFAESLDLAYPRRADQR